MKKLVCSVKNRERGIVEWKGKRLKAAEMQNSKITSPIQLRFSTFIYKNNHFSPGMFEYKFEETERWTIVLEPLLKLCAMITYSPCTLTW